MTACRRALDAYLTPPALAAAIVDAVSYMAGFPKRILEPTAGDGAFVAACRERWPDARIDAVDIDPSREAACLAAGADVFAVADATTMKAPPPDLIIGNPPFSVAEEIIDNLLRDAPHGPVLAFLLRISFLAGPRWKPGRLYARHPLIHFAPIVPRPSFTADGKTDMSEYGLFVFGNATWAPESTLGDPVRWDKARRKP